MKTPREILLERHHGIEPKLDSIGRKALAQLEQRSVGAHGYVRHAGSNEQTWKSLRASRYGLREFLRSFRWHLTGLSAAWLVVVWLNIDGSSAPSYTIAKGNAPSPQQLLTALRENRRQLLELTGAGVRETEPAVPTSVPARRSERQLAKEMYWA